jgi:hypothetical protein
MGDWLILLLLVPAIVAPIVLLLGFAGCKFEHGTQDPNLALDSAVGTSPTTINLTWSYDTAQIVTFNFVRLRLPDRTEQGTFPVAASPASGGGRTIQSYDDPDVLMPGTSYEYTVDGLFADGEIHRTSSPVVGMTLSAPPSFDISFLSNFENTADQPSYTFPLVDFGAAEATRRIIVAIAGRDVGNAALSISSVTIGGIAATEVVSATGDDRRVALYIASVPTGSGGDIVVQFGNTSLFCGIGVWRGTNFASDTPIATATQVNLNGLRRVEASLTIPSGGGGLGYLAWSAAGTGGTAPTWTWTNLTEDFDVTISGDTGSSGATSLAAGTAVRRAAASVDLDLNGGVLVLAAWGPA